MSSSCKLGSEFSYRVVTRGEVRVYERAYQPQSRPMDAGDHYALSVSVAPSGTFLTAAQYQDRYNQFHKTYADRGPEFFRAEFPSIGARAQKELIAVGPGGAAHGVTFTTKDERYDVQVVVHMLLSDNVPDPACNTEDLARRIEARYENLKH
jgi:hypothetical protein